MISLPHDIRMFIALLVDPVNIGTLFQTCKTMAKLDTDRFWKTYYSQWVQPAFERRPELIKNGSYKQAFRENYSEQAEWDPTSDSDLWNIMNFSTYKTVKREDEQLTLYPCIPEEWFKSRPQRMYLMAIDGIPRVRMTLSSDHHLNVESPSLKCRVYPMYHQLRISLEHFWLHTHPGHRERLLSKYRMGNTSFGMGVEFESLPIPPSCSVVGVRTWKV